MKLTATNVGTRFFDERPVTVTDPGYDAGTWCTLQGVKVKPGTYECVAWKGVCGYTDFYTKKRHRYQRVFCCGIYLEGERIQKESFEEIGSIGVDAGLAGFFQDKPDYGNDEWDAFCERINRKNHLITEEGFCTESGWGDGCYPVFAARNEMGEVIALEIRF